MSYKDHVTNEEVCRKIQAAIGEYDELLILVKKRKLRWFGHVSRSSGLAKTILHGTVKGKRKKGRQEKRWEDNIKEWTGLDFASSARAAENRTRWKGIVANSSNSTSMPQGQQLCQTILKSMHKCTGYDPDKSGRMHNAHTHNACTKQAHTAT